MSPANIDRDKHATVSKLTSVFWKQFSVLAAGVPDTSNVPYDIELLLGFRACTKKPRYIEPATADRVTTKHYRHGTLPAYRYLHSVTQEHIMRFFLP